MLVLFHNQVCLPRTPLAGCRQPHQPILNFPAGTAPASVAHARADINRKRKVVFVMGATGTGKSRLAIDLATRLGGEVINSDKMQVYDGLHIATNKVTDDELAAVPHHLIGGVHPDADFSTGDFRREAVRAIEEVLSRGRLPIVAGGSNSYIEELVDGEAGWFRSRFECCFLWVDVDTTVLHEFVAARVDSMVDVGLVEEVRRVFDPKADYSRGVRRAIGVPEMDSFFRAEAAGAEKVVLERILAAAIDEVKANTCRLACCQLGKIHRLLAERGWDIRRVEATKVFEKKLDWETAVVAPSIELVQEFLEKEEAKEVEVEGSNQFAVSVDVKKGVRANGTAAAMCVASTAEAVGATT